MQDPVESRGFHWLTWNSHGCGEKPWIPVGIFEELGINLSVWRGGVVA